MNQTITTNDIVINKLTQILAYLRHGGNKQARDGKKIKKKLKEDETVETSTAKITSGYSSLGFILFVILKYKFFV